jgi:hypothetical protein
LANSEGFVGKVPPVGRDRGVIVARSRAAYGTGAVEPSRGEHVLWVGLD